MEKHLLASLGTSEGDGYIRATFLANFLNLPYIGMRESKMIVKGSVAAVLLLCSTGALPAQDWGSSVSTDTAKVDTVASNPDASGTSSNGGWGLPSDAVTEPQLPKRVPYKRFIPPYDSLREIIYYEGIIEDEGEFPEKNAADSLYIRAKKFLVQRYGKENIKKWTVEDKKNDRITLKVLIPMVIKRGEYSKQQSGLLEYKLTIRFKDGRYKYQFGNFVHVESPNGLGKEPTRTYHEYYMHLKRGYEATDGYLLAADREVHEVVSGLKKSLHEPFQPDEDDW